MMPPGYTWAQASSCSFETIACNNRVMVRLKPGHKEQEMRAFFGTLDVCAVAGDDGRRPVYRQPA